MLAGTGYAEVADEVDDVVVSGVGPREGGDGLRDQEEDRRGEEHDGSGPAGCRAPDHGFSSVGAGRGRGVEELQGSRRGGVLSRLLLTDSEMLPGFRVTGIGVWIPFPPRREGYG